MKFIINITLFIIYLSYLITFGEETEASKDCYTIFSECNFQGEQQKICENNPEIIPFKIKSIKVPKNNKNYGITFFNDTNFNGQIQDFTLDNDCINAIENSTNYVEFDLKVNSFPKNYASHPITRGLKYPKIVWTFYLFGQDSGPDNQAGEFAIFGTAVKGFRQLSNTVTLKVNQWYKVKWILNNDKESLFYLNNELISNQTSIALRTDITKNTYIIDDMYVGGGRQHSKFDGLIENIFIREKK